ncbi:MAG: SMC-Scp complex subunit ScpB [Candidatus Woesearchaeota archaeon]
MDEELKRMVEAILFAAARKLELEEISKLCHRPKEEILAVLTEWKSQLDSSNSPTMLLQDGTAWKLTVREKYVPVIKKVVTKTELPKGILETLAVVAYKAPVLQSKVVKIRTNKAYDHLAQLENSGFITRERHGRSKMVKLTPKFFEYFDIDPSKLKQKFSSAGDVEKAIEEKEREIEQLEAAQRKQTEEQLGKPQIVLEDGRKPLEQYLAVEPVKDMISTGVEIVEEKMGDLPVYDVPIESLPPEERPSAEPPHSHHKHHKKKPAKKHQHAIHHAPKPKEAHEKFETTAVEEKIEIPKVEEKKEALEEIPLTPEQKIAQEAEEKVKRLKEKKFEEGKGLYPEGVPPEIEAKIEEKIKKMLSGEKEEEEKKE